MPGVRLGFRGGASRGSTPIQAGTPPARTAHQYSTTMRTPLPGSISLGWGAADVGPRSPLIAAGSAPVAASGCDATARAREGAGPRVTSGCPLQAATALLLSVLS